MSADDALAALSIDLPQWYVYGAQQRRIGEKVIDSIHAPPRWRVDLQHRDGALLTVGAGESFAGALWSAIEGAKAVERGRANCRAAEPRRLLPPNLDPETASL